MSAYLTSDSTSSLEVIEPDISSDWRWKQDESESKLWPPSGQQERLRLRTEMGNYNQFTK